MTVVMKRTNCGHCLTVELAKRGNRIIRFWKASYVYLLITKVFWMRSTVTAWIIALFCSCSNSSGNSTEAVTINSTDTSKPPAKDSLKEELSLEIAAFINSGFYDQEEIFESLRDMFYREILEEDWLRGEIRRQYNQRLAHQSSWEQETDFDRLARVFDRLNSTGIIALHNAGYTRQDGEGDVEELYERLKRKGFRTKGSCFYHAQDIDRVIESDTLYLAFGTWEGNDRSGEQVGREVITALQKEGFKTNWNDSIGYRIEVVGLKWQKRFGNGNCSRERAIRLLSNH